MYLSIDLFAGIRKGFDNAFNGGGEAFRHYDSICK